MKNFWKTLTEKIVQQKADNHTLSQEKQVLKLDYPKQQYQDLVQAQISTSEGLYM